MSWYDRQMEAFAQTKLGAWLAIRYRPVRTSRLRTGETTSP